MAATTQNPHRPDPKKTCASQSGLSATNKLMAALAATVLGSGVIQATRGATYEQAQAIISVQQRVDTDGIPLVYTPRSWKAVFVEELEVLREIRTAQYTIINLLEKLTEKE